MVCTCCGHWRVERIVLDQREVLRVTYRGYLVADCRRVEEVARHVDLAVLSEVTPPA
jgi:hypothetical protein